MALNPADIATVSRLLDDALALDPAEREPWLAALPAEHQRHAEALRDMLAQEAQLDTDPRLAAMPKLATDDAVAHAGDRIGPYRLMYEIGRGGMGSVWLAERADGAYQRQVALKLPRLAWGAGLAERMAREREIGMLLEHPNIARLYDAGVDERGRPFLALEYVDGQPIDTWCDAQGLGVRERMRLFVLVARAVAYAHGRLVVHRDLKPSNVLVTSDGQAHLLDFGIAKLLLEAAPGESGLTQEQGRVLTPHYASPEQVAGEAITVQADVYSLGVLLYELLTGTVPIAPKRGTLGAVEEAILDGDVPLASSRVKDRAKVRVLRGEVDAILVKSMRREPARRYATADALALDIERHLQGETVTARPDSVGYRLRKAVRRHWIGVAAVTAVMVAVLTGSGVALVQAQRAARATERERVVKAFVADVFRANGRVDPGNAALRPMSPQSLLVSGAQLIQQRFAGQPELQAELFGVVGGVFSDMGAYKLAADYSTRRIEALALLRAEPIEQAKALLVLAQALVDDGKYSDAEPRVRRAREWSVGDLAVSLDATLLLAYVQHVRRIEDPNPLLDQAEAMLARQGPSPSTARSKATFLRAALTTASNRLDEALPIYQQAIDTALLSEGTLSLTAIDFRLGVSRLLAQTTYRAAAQKHFDAATAALRQLGGAHELRAAFATAEFAERQRIGGRQIAATDAVAALERSRAVLMASSLPVPDWWVPQIDFWLGGIKVDSGDIAGGLPLLEANEAVLRKNFETPSQSFDLAWPLGLALMHAGRHDLAGTFLRKRQEARRESGGSAHPYALTDYFYVATNLLMQGRNREAEAVLEAAPRSEPMRGEGTNPQRYNYILIQLRAQIRLAVGDFRGALALLQESTPFAEQGADDWAYFNDVRGEALCAAGEETEGLATLKPLAALAERIGDLPQAPWLARRAAVIGHCKLGTGDRKAALAYASRARAAFTAQPGVSPYYKAPLFKLERALGLKLPPV